MARFQHATGRATCAICNKSIEVGSVDVTMTVNSRAQPHFHPQCLIDLGEKGLKTKVQPKAPKPALPKETLAQRVVAKEIKATFGSEYRVFKLNNRSVAGKGSRFIRILGICRDAMVSNYNGKVKRPMDQYNFQDTKGPVVAVSVDDEWVRICRTVESRLSPGSTDDMPDSRLFGFLANRWMGSPVHKVSLADPELKEKMIKTVSKLLG